MLIVNVLQLDLASLIYCPSENYIFVVAVVFVFAFLCIIVMATNNVLLQ